MEDAQYSDYFDRIFKEHCKGREEHEFRFKSESLGMTFRGKEHYKHYMKTNNLLPYAETERMAEKYDKEHPRKEYGDLSPKATDILRSIKMTADSEGNIKLGGRAIEALKDIGAIQPMSEHIPSSPQQTGGFS